jgi:low temperature requirement protein LtrA
MNYSWFASAYDNDDWVFRIATMVQMVRVIILSLGIPEMFASIDLGGALDVGVMVVGGGTLTAGERVPANAASATPRSID